MPVGRVVLLIIIIAVPPGVLLAVVTAIGWIRPTSIWEWISWLLASIAAWTAFLGAFVKIERRVAEWSNRRRLKRRPLEVGRSEFPDLVLPISTPQIIADHVKASGHATLHVGDTVFNIQQQSGSFVIDNPALASQYLGAINRPVLFPARATEQTDIPSTLPPLPNPALWVEGNFVGREQIIQELMAAVDTTRMIVILGIPGVGKTALMAQIASRLEPSQVFGYRFRPGLISLDSVLISLAHFLDNHP
jgi:hypothetical protein